LSEAEQSNYAWCLWWVFSSQLFGNLNEDVVKKFTQHSEIDQTPLVNFPPLHIAPSVVFSKFHNFVFRYSDKKIIEDAIETFGTKNMLSSHSDLDVSDFAAYTVGVEEQLEYDTQR
jgi:hypothetical protein